MEVLAAVEWKTLVLAIGLLVVEVVLELDRRSRYGMANAALCTLGITTEECTAPELVAGWLISDDGGAVVVAFVDVDDIVPFVKVPNVALSVALMVSEVSGDGDDVTAG